jgi:hypothetical protein
MYQKPCYLRRFDFGTDWLRSQLYCRKDLGLPADKKPVVGVIVASFVVNSETNPMGPLLGVKFGEDVTQCLKDAGIESKVVKFAEVQTHKQLAAAIKKYGLLQDYWKRVSEEFDFGDMKGDFSELGIDLLVILSGSASNASVPAWAQAATFVAFGATSLVTPSTDIIATSVNRDGRPIFNDRTIFTRMGRRDFGNEGHRKAMASAIADEIKDNSI